MMVDEDRRWLTQKQVMELEGKKREWVRTHAEELGVRRNGQRAANGKLLPLYDLHRLSPEAQLKWARQQKVVPISVGSEPGGESQAADDEFRFLGEEESASTGQLALDLVRPDGSNLEEADRKQAEGRYEVIAALIEPKRFRPLWAQCDGKRTKVRDELAKQHGVSPRTIHNWVQRYLGTDLDAYEGIRGLTALVDNDRKDKNQPRLMNHTAFDLLLHLMHPEERRSGQLTIAKAWKTYNEERLWRLENQGKVVLGDEDVERLAKYLTEENILCAEAQLPKVSYWTFRAWWRNLPAAGIRLGRRGLESFLNTDVQVSYRNYLKLDPLEFVVMDHRQLDLTCQVPERRGRGREWKLGRPWVTAAIDMRTRRWLAWKIVEQPNSASIAAVLKRVFLDHGLPKNFYWDNGQDFECGWLDAVLTDLGVNVTHSLVRRARAKMIEPNFKALAQFEAETPWWCGHKTEARPESHEKLVEQYRRWEKQGRDAQKADNPFLNIEEVGTLYNDLFTYLNDQPHSGHGMQKTMPDGWSWMSPDECWRDLIGGKVLERVPTNTLLFMFRERRQVKVRHAQVEMSYHGTKFIYNPAPDVDPMTLMHLNDKKVELAIDTLDLQTVAVFYRSRFVCLVENMALRGMGEEAFKEDEANRRRAYLFYRDYIQAAHEQVRLPGPVERLRRRAASREAVAESPEQRPEVTVAYPEAERAVAAAAGDGFAFSRSTARVESVVVEEDPEDSEFEFFT